MKEPEKEVHVKHGVDVLVVGGGPSGIMAAWAASEEGLKVALVENKGYLGGNLTIGLPILGFHSQKGVQIIRGLADKFVKRLADADASSDIRLCPLHMSIAFIEPETVKVVAPEMLLENNVSIFLHSLFVDVIKEGDLVKGVVIENKTGRHVILGKVVIDCSGDADVAYRSGMKYNKGNKDGRMQPGTLEYSMENVDVDKLRKCVSEQPDVYTPEVIPPEYYKENRYFILVGLSKIVEKAKSDGLKMPVDKVVIVTGLGEGEMWINMTRVNGVDGTDPDSLTHAEISSRKQVSVLTKFFNQYVPGFEKARVGRVAPFIGIRETRRIEGNYVLTREDILSRRTFDDAIAVASYPLDIHHPVGGGFSLDWSGDCYDIPYRSLISDQTPNLIVAGRSISTTHEAMSSIRVMAPCMAMGEAAGRAAALALKTRVQPVNLDTRILREHLISKGVYLR